MPPAREKPVAQTMARKLAYRNLFHDRVSLLVTLVGILFSVVLISVMCSMYIGMGACIVAVMDHIKADLWIVPEGVKSFDLPLGLLRGREKHAALSTPGVQSADNIIISFIQWRRFSNHGIDSGCATATGRCGTITALLVGADATANQSLPWDFVNGSATDLSTPNAVAIDKVYFKELGVEGVGDHAEINFMQATVKAVTEGIRSFTTIPYVFVGGEAARKLVGAETEEGTYVLVRVAPGNDVEAVRKSLQARLPNMEVLTHQDLRQRSHDYWLYNTGAGAGLIAGMVLAIIVGVVVVAQTLYASTKEHLNEFATLRALGASSGFLCKVILWQAVLSATIGYILGMIVSIIVIYLLASVLPILMTFNLAAGLLALTIVMCTIAAISAIFKVIRIDPAVVFSR
jgi:putative ABC transport system permease protein